MTPVKLETQHTDREPLNTFGAEHSPVRLGLKFVVDGDVWVPLTNLSSAAWENIRCTAGAYQGHFYE